MASAFKVGDEIEFTVQAPEGKIAGNGKIAAIFAAGTSYWLHVLQPDNTVRMIFEAKADIKLRELEPA